MDSLDEQTMKNNEISVTTKIEFFPSGSSPYGETYGQWTVKWWKWCFSTPREINATIDEIGIYANQGQSEPVWFLAGCWVRPDRKYPHRKCSIQAGVSILFPLINCEENPLEYPDLKSKEDMKKRLLHDMGTVRELECSVNGNKIIPQLVESDPEFFEIDIRSDMAENKRGGHTVMTASGYYIFLKPLPSGKYYISFEGSYQYGRLYSGATYDILVV
jgi:hypothetical protein